MSNCGQAVTLSEKWLRKKILIEVDLNIFMMFKTVLVNPSSHTAGVYHDQ